MSKLKHVWDFAAKHWNEFFFKPTSPATLGLFRIGFGTVVFLSTLGRYPFRNMFYTDDGIVSYHTMTRFLDDSWFYFRFLPAHDPALNIYFLGLLAAIVCLIVGFQTRIASVLVFLGMMSLSNRNFFIDNAGDDLVRINTLILMFADCGRAYSVDRWIRVKRGLERANQLPLVSPWAQRLLQLQVAWLYCQTFFLKLPGPEWQDGTAIYYALHYIELKRFELRPLFYYLWQIKLATYVTLAGECALWSLVWFRKLRYWIIATGIALHIGINLTLQFPIFQYVMIASLLNFIYPEDVERAVAYVSGFIKKQTGRFPPENRPASAA